MMVALIRMTSMRMKRIQSRYILEIKLMGCADGLVVRDQGKKSRSSSKDEMARCLISASKYLEVGRSFVGNGGGESRLFIS